MVASITSRGCAGSLLTASASPSATQFVVGVRATVRRPSKTWGTRLGPYWTYKAVNGNPPQKKIVNGSKWLGKLTRSREEIGNNATLWKFRITAHGSRKTRSTLRHKNHGQKLGIKSCLRLRVRSMSQTPSSRTTTHTAESTIATTV